VFAGSYTRTISAMNGGGLGGTLIDGRFELLERLGGGAMGLVWRARDVVLQREVALKEVRPPDPASLEFDPEGARVLRERVLREARALARLHHPNVVTIYHIVDTPELPHPWLVMELVTGGSLDDRLKQGPMTPPDAARVGRGVLAALRAAHEAGIQHRDVKPANVLLRSDGTPVLTDFGIAALRESTALTSTGSVIGSPEFIAPERLRGEEGNPASDLWSLGILVYAAAEGYSPLRRTTTMATLAAVLDEPIPAPVRSGPLLPALSAVLVRDPAARCGADLLDRLLAEAEYSQGMASGMAPGMGSSMGMGMSPGLGMSPALGQSLGQVQGGRQGQGTPSWGVDSSGNQPAYYRDAIPSSNTAQSLAPHDTVRSRHGAASSRSRGKAAFATVVAGTAAVGLIGALIWTMGQNSKNNTLSGSAQGSVSPLASAHGLGASSLTNSAQPSQSAPPSAPANDPAVNLLTPGGVQALIKNVKSVMGDTTITDFTIYPDHAEGDVLTSANSTLYDSYDFSDNQGQDTGPGGTLDDTDQTIDLSSFDWNALPALLATAQQDFKVVGTPQIYVIVSPGWLDLGPSLMIYVTDSYSGGGYITANQKGQVTGKF